MAMRNVINENQYLDQVLEAIWDYCRTLEQYYYDPEEDHSYMSPEMQNLINIPGLDDGLFFESLLIDYDSDLNFDYGCENLYEDKCLLSWAYKEMQSELHYVREKFGLEYMVGGMGVMDNEDI